MKTTNVLRAAVLCLFAAACADNIPVEPTSLTRVENAAALRAAATSDEAAAEISPVLAEMNEQLAAAGMGFQILKAEIVYQGAANAESKTLLLANDRARGIGSEWVKGDPRRGERTGVTYAIGGSHFGAPFVWNAAHTGFRQLTGPEIVTQIEEGVSAWRDRSCNNALIERVAVPAGKDPTQLDEFFRKLPPSANYAQPADIVQAGWQPTQFFRNIAGGPAGDGILGVTFSFIFVDTKGTPTPTDDVATDIDGNGKGDLALAEIYYHGGYLWGADGAADVLDFYSIITHETGHALGLNHFGKIFVTKKDLAEGIEIDEVKFAPLAMMNALYLTGRSEIRGTDNSSFCQLWASK
jgi:hypothetical protein